MNSYLNSPIKLKIKTYMKKIYYRKKLNIRFTLTSRGLDVLVLKKSPRRLCTVFTLSSLELSLPPDLSSCLFKRMSCQCCNKIWRSTWFNVSVMLTIYAGQLNGWRYALVKNLLQSMHSLSQAITHRHLLNTQHYKVWIKGKVEQSRKRISALLYISV